jgi:hypothetical protein
VALSQVPPLFESRIDRYVWLVKKTSLDDAWMHCFQTRELPLLLPWPDNINYDQELVDAPPDALPDWAFRLMSVVVWIGVPVVFWGGIAAWLI